MKRPEGPPSDEDAPASRKLLMFNEFRFDPDGGILQRNGTDLVLPPRALSILKCLLKRPGEVISKDNLLDAAWNGLSVGDQSLSEAVGLLRRALADDPQEPTYIQTVHRRGYRFIAPVSVETSDGPRPAEATEKAPPRRRRSRRAVLLATGAALVVLAVVFIAVFQRNPVPPLPFEERDWVLVADFENHTGNPTFDGVLSYALERELVNSRFVNVAPRGRVADTLLLMRKPPETLIDESVGREVCLRDGGIRALITGRIEKVGSAYVLSADLVDPATGVHRATASEEAPHEDDVAGAVEGMSIRFREVLGENLDHLTEYQDDLRKVTTPSFRALKLYSQGVSLVDQYNWSGAAELLEQAVTEDPDFASAHIYLAHCYSNLRQRDMAAPHYEKAFALADTTTESERYFILGSYYGRFQRDDEKAFAAYQALLKIDPNHYWCRNNMLMRYQPGEAIRHRVYLAQIRPNSYVANVNAAAALSDEDLNAAKPYVERARDLMSSEGVWSNITDEQSNLHPNWIAWIDFFDAYECWMKGDPAGAQAEIERLERTLASKSGKIRESYTDYAGFYYLVLGMANEAEKLFLELPVPWLRESRLALVALARDDDELTAEHLRRSVSLGGDCEVFRSRAQTSAIHAVLSSRAGLQEEAQILEACLDKLRYVFKDTVKGELAIAGGDDERGISFLQKAFAELGRMQGRPPFFYGSVALAEGWRKKGNLEQAISVLERATRQRHGMYPYSGPFWMDAYFRLSKLYRECGRDSEAREIEDELRGLLKLADPDHCILRELASM